MSRVRQYLDAHPDDSGQLIVDDGVAGGRVYAGFVSRWCDHRDALRRLAGTDAGVEVFAVAQSSADGKRLADRVMAAGTALRRAGIQLATAGVDARTGLTSVTTPNDPATAREAILRELGLNADAPLVVTRGSVIVPAAP
ncbi:hypothetical protein ACNTMW_04965 [Planosporangium sp. 12N6]|uniref:hypothetical protein n=1 Tax=Planosporangium spinosum TaxID=3402278 RepID=UPI003CEB0D4B